MYSIKSYIKYLFRAKHKNGHGIHSPFVYKLVTEVINPAYDSNYYPEAEREKLLKNDQYIYFNDFGSGKSGQRKISQIAKRSLASAKECILLGRMIKFIKPACCIELGTSLGLTTACMAKALSPGPVYTIDGCPEAISLAKELAERQHISNITFLTGKFEDVLPSLIPAVPEPFIAFVDGNHTCEATLSYFYLLKEHSGSNSVIIIHDIHQNKGMEKAWNQIISDNAVTASIDIYSMGIIFFNKALQKQLFTIKF